MIIIDIITDFIGHTTAKLVLPLLTFGKLRVAPLASSETGFNWLGCKRQADGTILIASDTAGYIGLIPWILALIVFLAVR
ncbi:MAG: hypothetical protein KDJ62_12890 [Rhodobiaceae bacterium]|nr:hypothetical protein [Rhodobiaceae bacterium]MCC0048792.1 hypothetical protein [Rhodobiaceae bacterium]